jgi:hypothetical protein
VAESRDTPRRREFERWLWDRHRVQLKLWHLVSAQEKQRILADWERYEAQGADEEAERR